MPNHANPITGAMDDEAIVDSLLAPEEDKPEEEEAELSAPDMGDEEDVSAEDGAGEDEPEAEEGPEEEEEEQPIYTVKVDGEEMSVTLDELLNGYQREADYRRKTMAMAEDRRAVAAERQRQEQITAQLIEAYQKAGAGNEKEPDWAKLAEELDPWEYQKQRATWETQQRARAEARRQAEALQQQRVLQFAHEQVQLLKQKEPKWSTREAFETALGEMASVAHEAYGYAPEEVTQTLDHRALLVLRDAVAYRKLKQAKPAVEKRIAKAPRVVKPGARQSKAERQAADQEARRNRFRETGSIDDAVEFLLTGD